MHCILKYLILLPIIEKLSNLTGIHESINTLKKIQNQPYCKIKILNNVFHE